MEWPVLDNLTGEVVGYVGSRFVKCRTDGCPALEFPPIEVADNGGTVICGDCNGIIEAATEMPTGE